MNPTNKGSRLNPNAKEFVPFAHKPSTSRTSGHPDPKDGNVAGEASNPSAAKRSISYETAQNTHFISLPLAIHPELVEKFSRFQNSILRSNNASTLPDLGIDESIFAKPQKLHLTVLMLKLSSSERLDKAKEVLQSISPKLMDALDGRPVSIRLKGLDCMRGSLAKARVLYAPVEEIGNEDRLMRACQVIIDAYIDAGLVLEKDARQKLKLHATLMNAKHRKSKMRTEKIDSFDARAIFEKYGSKEWGEYHIREAHLSQRFVYDDSGYYHCCASLPFPTSTPVE